MIKMRRLVLAGLLLGVALVRCQEGDVASAVVEKTGIVSKVVGVTKNAAQKTSNFVLSAITLKPLLKKVLTDEKWKTSLFNFAVDGRFASLNKITRFNAVQAVTGCVVVAALYTMYKNVFGSSQEDQESLLFS